MRSFTIVQTTHIRSVDAAEKYKFAVRSMDIAGLTMWIASLAISVRMPSVGVMSKLTPKTAETPANAAAMPASG